MSASELHYAKVGPSGEKVLVVGATPRISVDIRIKCPRPFHGREAPSPPPPPNFRYVEIAQNAVQKILAAMWPCRQFLEAVKVGYALDQNSPFRLYVTGEVVIVIPAIAEKNILSEQTIIAGGQWNQDYRGFDLDGPDLIYDETLDSLTSGLAKKAKEMVANQIAKLDAIHRELRIYQEVFGISD